MSGAASTGFTVTYGGASAGLDVPNIALVNLSCGGCFASVEETNHGGALDSFRVAYGANVSAPITNGGNFTTDGIQTALQGVGEVQTVSLTNYTTDGDSYTLNYNGANTVPITRGQNNTGVGITAALTGGNEVQVLNLTGFNAANAGNSFQIQIGGNNSAVLGNGGLAITNANVAAAVNAIPGFTGTVTSVGAGNTGFTLSFQGASAGTDVPSIAIVNLGCSPTCTAAVRESVKGGPPVAGWPAGGTVITVADPTDSGYALAFGGTLQGTDVSQVTLTNLVGVTGSTVETTKGTPGSFRRLDRDRRRLRRRSIEQHRLPGHVRRGAQPHGRPDDALASGLQRRRLGLRRGDRQGRCRRQQGRDHHHDRGRDPGRDRPGAVHDPAADAVRSHRQRDGRGRRRHARSTAGSRTTAAPPRARRS